MQSAVQASGAEDGGVLPSGARQQMGGQIGTRPPILLLVTQIGLVGGQLQMLLFSRPS